MRLIYLESQQGLRCIEPSSNGSQVFRWFSPLHFTWFISLESLCCTADSFTAHLPSSLYAVARSFDPPLVYPFFHPMKSLARLPSMRRKHTWNFESLGCHITCLVPTQNHHQTRETPRWLYDHQLVRLRRPWSLPGFLSHHKVDEIRNCYHRRSSDDLPVSQKYAPSQRWGLNRTIKKMYRDPEFYKNVTVYIPKIPYFGCSNGSWKLCVLLLNVHHQNQKIFTVVSGPPLQKHFKRGRTISTNQSNQRIPIQVPKKSPTFPTWALHFPNFQMSYPRSRQCHPFWYIQKLLPRIGFVEPQIHHHHHLNTRGVGWLGCGRWKCWNGWSLRFSTITWEILSHLGKFKWI